MVDVGRHFIGGVDTHMDNHVAVVVDQIGRVQGTEAFPATAAGYRKLLTWMRRFGKLIKVGVEGTGAYGAGLGHYLSAEGVEVVEVNRPNRQFRRQRGKSDPTDAEAAARAVLSGEANSTPKARMGAAEGIRAVRVARRGAVKASTQAANQLRDLILTAPDGLRARMRALPRAKQVELAARFRPGAVGDPVEDTKAAMRAMARRHQGLAEEIVELDGRLAELVEQAAPDGLLEKQGVAIQVASQLLSTVGGNPERLKSEASFAALCGASPVDASSGKQIRHRLNQGGDRQANSALWRIAFSRMRYDPRTRAYAERRRAEGRTDKEIIRCLKRYIAREIYKTLVPSQAVSAPPEIVIGSLTAAAA
ncbi:MAG: IS110 family transposase [Acidimicrobiales bacterium]